MSSCIVCGNETEGNREYCDCCFHTAIDELNQKYGKKEGLSDPAKESKEAQAHNPLTEDVTH